MKRLEDGQLLGGGGRFRHGGETRAGT